VKKNDYFVLILILFSLMVFLFQPYSHELLAYQYQPIQQGEYWRLITHTLAHTNFFHLMMNIAGLILILFVFISTFKHTPLFSLFIFNTLFISVCLVFFESHHLTYVGLSGTLHGLFSYAVCRDILRKEKWGELLAVIGVLKIIGEQYFGTAQTTSHLINAPVLVNAHLYGAIAGIFFFILRDLSKYFKLRN